MNFSNNTLFQENWFIAAFEKDLDINRAYSLRILGQSLMIWKNKQLEVFIFRDQCPHRNIPLSSGKIINNSLVCPYHGWAFNEMGRCIHIPSVNQEGEKTSAQLHKYPTVLQEGVVWVYMGDRKTFNNFDWQSLNRKKGNKHFWLVNEFNSTIEDLIENFLDVPHTAWVHKGWFRKQEGINISAALITNENEVIVNYNSNEDKISGIGSLLGVNGKKMLHIDKFILPNAVEVTYEFESSKINFKSTSFIVPETEGICKVYTHISYDFSKFNFLAKTILPWYVQKVLDQDKRILQLQTDNRKNFKKPRNETSTLADLPGLYARKLLKKTYDDNKKEIITKKTKNIKFQI